MARLSVIPYICQPELRFWGAVAGRTVVQQVMVRDLDGAVLATAILQEIPDGPRLSLHRVVSGKGRLLQHYFARGLRAVTIDSGEFQLRGVLSTRWLNAERRWFVELRPLDHDARAAGNPLPAGE